MIAVHTLGTAGTVVYLAIANPLAPGLYALLAIDTATFTSSLRLPVVGDQLSLEACAAFAEGAGAK